MTSLRDDIIEDFLDQRNEIEAQLKAENISRADAIQLSSENLMNAISSLVQSGMTTSAAAWLLVGLNTPQEKKQSWEEIEYGYMGKVIN